ncbi:DNA-binding transcriptional ArsR family regulator [Actinoplanes tereljensis]|nr:winged helix-turn-helix domain-containing protein [Actinoplanes tereljensis]
MAERGVRVSDPRVMRALSHPARIEIVEYLNDSGAAVTATECASMVGLSPSATSYHLRELAKYGLVEQAPSRGDGRERLWRSVAAGLRIDPDMAEPAANAAARALVDLYLNRDLERARDWFSRLGTEPEEWRRVGAMRGDRLLITTDELKALVEKITELIEPYGIRERQDSAPEGARRVAFSMAAYPEPDRT